MKAEDIVRIYNRLKAERNNIEGMWAFMSDYVLPYSVDVYGNTSEEGNIDWRKRTIYDNTAVEACDALSASLQGNLISPSVRWFDLTFQNNTLNNDMDAKEWLEACGEIIFLKLQSSNFNLEAAEALLDLCAFGTMALLEEVNDKDEIVFSSASIMDILFEIGSMSNVLRFYRKLQWTALQIQDKFGIDGLPDDILDELEKGVSKKHDIIFCIYEIPENKDADTSKILAVKARPFGFKYVLVEGAIVLKEGGYYEQPTFITRWRTTSGSVWGNAPGFKCLASILDVNEMAELILEEAALNIEPPLMTTQRGVISDLERQRAGLTVVTNMNDIAPLPGRGDANLAMIDVQALREQIRRSFYEDQLQLKDSPAMTATEVNVRYELMNRLLGPTMGRLKVEFLDPLITRTFAILHRLGKMPPAPKSVIDAKAEFDVVYSGPLPRSQKVDTARSIAGFIGQLGSLAQTFPDVLDIVDIDGATRGMGELGGVPAKFMRTDAEVKKIRTDRIKRQEKANMYKDLKNAGDAMQSLGAGSEALPANGIEAIQKAIAYNGEQ
jgi:hypothetical protein